ncbi:MULTISPECIES: Lrp/AsnC family transcriptional regulator [unclassified Paenibacillus]|uniref:Lrp/AsnC family transcriptional regulator n=1 Tax=unclassified Paenibacillus TaxID=185978 RepID=UPI000955BA51|nr:MULTISPECIES: Lrp/AsnC family transcriptional regulator [unclassified Paenibacillus]ASS67500.1 Lrp/AsnC family transcriptional regulator [Paenibacillus sp. RUD330]SIQ74767.1 DNA-binding transcriptional regulator, Lrp family [Paenibacillus sp. RU4X]SIQ96217.1 DNA-binding transcriptional regulator, Lrp family [Paenibacillus sp. RU4T]
MNTLLDESDHKIMLLLQARGRIPVAQISKEISMSQPAVKERILKLEERGFITGYTVRFDLSRLGRGTTAFIMMKTEHCQELVDYCGQAAEVTELHRISGEYNYMIKVQTASIEQLADFQDSLARMGSSKSMISMKTILEDRVLL